MPQPKIFFKYILKNKLSATLYYVITENDQQIVCFMYCQSRRVIS